MSENRISGGFVLYKRRWFVLMSFVCVNAVCQYVWCTFSSVLTDAWMFYGFQDAASGEFAMSGVTYAYMIGMIAGSIPASFVFDKFGWYRTVAVAAAFLAGFCFVRGFVGQTYIGMMICTCGCAATQPFIINAFGLISVKWFPPNERGIANGWGMVSTYLGVVMAQFGFPWLMTTFGMDIPQVLKVFGFLSIPMILFFIIAAKEEPPTPPADEELIERVDVVTGFKQLLKNKQFIIAVFLFWIIQGIYFVFSTLIEPILQFLNNDSLDSMFIGTLGTVMTITAVIATLALPLISDHSKSKKRLPMTKVCEVGAIVGLILFFLGHSVGLMIIAACLIGVFLMGITPILMVLGYETAYPVSEGTTEGLMQMGANGFGFILLTFVNLVFHGHHSGSMLFLTAAMAIAIIMTFFIKEKNLKDRRLEK